MRKEIKSINNLFCIIGLIFVTSCTNRIVLIHQTKDNVNFKSKDTILVKSIHRALLSDSLVVKQKNGNKKKYSNDSIWGYKESQGRLQRYFEGKFFTVQKTDFIWIYSQLHQQHDHNQRKAHTTFYFSLNASSTVYLLDERNLTNQFWNNSCFIEKIKSGFKHYKDYAAFIKANGDCKIIDYYNNCKKQN